MYFELYPQPEVHFHCFIAPFCRCNSSKRWLESALFERYYLQTQRMSRFIGSQDYILPAPLSILSNVLGSIVEGKIEISNSLSLVSTQFRHYRQSEWHFSGLNILEIVMIPEQWYVWSVDCDNTKDDCILPSSECNSPCDPRRVIMGSWWFPFSKHRYLSEVVIKHNDC